MLIRALAGFLFIMVALLSGLTDSVWGEAKGLRLFSEPDTYPIGMPAQSIAAGDFNRDGILDLAVTDGIGRTVSILLGDGKGRFGPPKKYPVSKALTGYIVAGDFNRDGILDLVIINNGRNSASILFGDGNGGFSPAKLITLVQDPFAAAVGDFNHDGKLDLAISSGLPSSVAILLGDGTGGFSEPTHFTTYEGEEGPSPRHLIAADFNKDGNLDLAVTLQFADRIALLLGDGKGKFSDPKEFQFPPGSRPRGLAIGDFNMDGKLDVAVTTPGAGHDIGILQGKGDGTFTLHHKIEGQVDHWSIASGDFNRDGKLDLVAFALGQKVSIFLGHGDGSFSSPLVYPTEGRPPDEFYNTVLPEDLNHDGYLDLVTVGEVPSVVSVLLNGLSSPGAFTVSEDFYMKKRPIQGSQMLVNPKDPNIVYLATANQGVFRSTDRGKSWHPINRGIKNALIYAMVADPSNPKILYIGTWGGGVYKTENGGDSWREINNGLTHVAVNALAIDPANPKIVYASTSMRMFRSLDGGEQWSPLGTEADMTPLPSTFYVPSLVLLPSSPPTLLMGSDRGISRWTDKQARWSPVSEAMKDKKITALAYDARTKTLYASAEEGYLFKSSDDGKTWSPWGRELEATYIRSILISPAQSNVVYLVSNNRGILIGSDGGNSWTENEVAPSEVRALAIDPVHPEILYAVTYKDGLFLSVDGGRTWKEAKNIELQSVEETLAGIIASEERSTFIASPPKEFAKCNQCHGWTDPNLRFFRKSFWQMSPSQRSWAFTVQRMAPGADLTPEEMANIINYMNTYYGLEKKD